MKEDRIQNSKSMDSRHLKAYKSDGRLSDQSLADEAGVGPRSYSCSSKAFTFSTGKIRDVSLHGVRSWIDYIARGYIHVACTVVYTFLNYCNYVP